MNLRTNEKGQGRMTLSFYLRLPPMPFYSWGNLLKPFGGSPPEKMHAHQRSL